ncbi:aminodeoxychorismate synthase component I [Aureisphaera sp. CAU 1614]|uniref:Aminodeoxychorismate synthase component I n=1 Tax=Halomarinibacterium sedimenti TaxID=2857106 RepID=A0A9X1FNJ9_9FLAO|nr:aminodeoxychorismate synthase component I [Halomarinibacterium sedimenti]MBW2937794.1 aminodeoxychorismate synthase component I [Halomarinibacterium sedimenti]
MRNHKTLSISFTEALKKKLLGWAQQFGEVIWLDSNQYQQNHSSFQAILAVDAFTAIKTDSYGAFKKLEEYQSTTKDWLFGYLTYDLKNDTEQLKSQNFDGLQFPDLYFFQPKKVFLFSDTEVEIQYLHMVDDEMESDWQEILNFKEHQDRTNAQLSTIKIRLRTSKDSYFEKVHKMLHHIERGDIYEANFCQEYFSENVHLNPIKTFFHLNDISKPPFATFLKMQQYYAFSASPERYIKRTGTKVISQPIKGTAKRLANSQEDKKMVDALRKNPKERSENIMITDLVRNDLSRFALKGSVEVEELCKVYTFEQVHQLISTIRCEVDENFSSVDILKNTFPMGSMTGAPKVSAMKIIEELEDTKRGLYSGAIGYFTPHGDFDFNVIIRSILYNKENQYVSYSVGGAITANSIPEDEYEECLLKAKAMREALEQTH